MAASEKPALFIGSSVEGLNVARLFHQALSYELTPTLWAGPSTFTASKYTLERLEEMLEQHPFALFVLSPDDLTQSRGNEAFVPRDNVIFELGLFIGRQGRQSVFFAIPDEPRVKLPSDLEGVGAVTYHARGLDGLPRFDVSGAASEILNAIRLRRPTVTRLPQTKPSPFWDVLSDTIVILYGVEPEDASNKRHTLSLRDLETAWELKSFLDRRYPAKRVWPVPTTESWERLIRSDADLVVVGGFVTNAEFGRHRLSYERRLRLRIGRLCVVDGQRVHIPEFLPRRGAALPRPDDPLAIENYPSNLMTRDYGFVFNGPMKIYGRERRVIAIAGIKGHGTRGAALYVTDGIDKHLEGRTLQNAEALELAVAVDVASDTVHNIDPIRILLDGESLLPMPRDYSKACELGRPCDGCDYGVHYERPSAQRVLTSDIRAIVFDLDDTLLDTFNSLIVPLEIQAAKAMVVAGVKEDPTTLASAMLHLRRTNPAKLESELQKIGGVDRRVLAIRRKYLEPSLDGVVLQPDVVKLLRTLRNRYQLYLLTSGKKSFQEQKVDRLEIRNLFAGIRVVPQSSADAKAKAIRAIVKQRGLAPEHVLVVGNRLDSEIAAGNMLSMRTIWIRHGEGSHMVPGPDTARPDVTLERVLDLEKLLQL